MVCTIFCLDSFIQGNYSKCIHIVCINILYYPIAEQYFIDLDIAKYIHPFIYWWTFDCFQFMIIIHKTKYSCTHICTDIGFQNSWVRTWSRMAGSYLKKISNCFARCSKILNPCQCVIWLARFNFSHLTGMEYYITIVSICIAAMPSDAEPLFMCLVIQSS